MKEIQEKPIFEAEISLTQSQLLLWIGQEMNPTSPMYNMVLTFEINGSIEISHFQAAFQALINKSDTLRTIFEASNGNPVQKIFKSLIYKVEVLDLTKEVDTKLAYNVWLKERVQIIFDLSTCLFDCVLVQFSEEHFIWYFNQHHLTTDAWSTSVIYKEMAQLYTLSLSGDLSETLPIPSFKDYVEFEKSTRIDERSLDTQLYWKNKLQDCPPFPLIYNTPIDEPTTKSLRVALDLGYERSEKLRQLASEKSVRSWTQNLSLYNIFASTLFAYLFKVSGQRKLVIGSPAHNRPSSSFKETIGIFIETFPLLASIGQGESFISLLKKIQIESNGFLRYAQPGASSSDLSRSFNVFFNYINATYTDFNEMSMTSEWIHPDHCDPLHHLRLQVHDFDKSKSIQLYFDLNCGVFDEAKRAVMPTHFLNLLDAFLENKEQEIAKVPTISPQEHQQLIIDFNKNKYETSEEKSIIELVEDQVQKTPNAIALVFKEVQFSYQQLNDQANQLAHYLSEQHIGKETQVAICLKRSPEFVISVLAVMKTGATYIPIPSNYPNERVVYLLKDSEASLLISDSTLTACINLSDVMTLHIDRFQQKIKNYPTINLASAIEPNSTAFLIYTSGSTGNPKGVVITNKALTNYIKWTEKAYINMPCPSIPLFTTIGFDITANSVFLPLICGGTIHVYQEKNIAVDLSMPDVIEDNKVDFIKLTPAHLSFLKGKKIKDSRLKVMVVTGDEFKTKLGQHIYKAFDGKLLIYDEYGPSEATIGCIYHQFTTDITIPSVPIGLPIHNMSAYVLDDYLNPVPQGVVGELYLGGVGLAAGYWNRPILTAEKFIANPFVENEKMYRTGDLARINENSIIEFLGRIDFQVKINGHRIELGEIESQITNFGSINASVVTVLENELGAKQLTAYFTSTSLVPIAKLRHHLASKLPAYMVPSHYRKLESFSLSPNGKVDRNALKILEAFAANTATEYVAPQTEIEETIAEIWQIVFNLPQIGIHDRFIDLGGESLKAIQITTRVSESLELDIQLSKIFEFPTIAEFSKYIEKTIVELLEMEDSDFE